MGSFEEVFVTVMHPSWHNVFDETEKLATGGVWVFAHKAKKRKNIKLQSFISLTILI